MARPKKVGLDYFPLDVDIDQDDKVYLIEAKHGLVGFALIIRLLMKIYKQGYYIPWGEKEAFVLAKQTSTDVNVVQNVVFDCINYGFFSRKLHDKYGILTSKGIQTRFLEACSRIKRRKITLVKEFVLIDVSEYSHVVLVPLDNSTTERETQAVDCVPEVEIIEPEAVLSGQNPSFDVQNTEETGVLGGQKCIKEKKRKEKKRKEYITSLQEVRSTNVQRSDLEQVMNAWNQLGVNPIKTLSPGTTRHKLLKARIKEYGIDAILEAIHRIRQSSFLRGGGKKGWMITFDWFIKPNNFPKVYEGAYDDNSVAGGKIDERKLGHEEYMRVVESYAEKRL